MHHPVLFTEVLDRLVTRPGGAFADGTAGSGGHAEGILTRAGAEARLLLIDRDAEALARTQARLKPWIGQCTFVHGNFAELETIAADHGFEAFDGILLDLGVSSEQLDTAERGFSLMRDGPLDMRMDRDRLVTAATLVNTLSEFELTDLFRRFGEEPRAHRVARALVRARDRAPLATTAELAETIAAALGGRHGRLHPATRCFQALRIAVNAELDALPQGLEAALNRLRPGGRLAVIAFHSLEDRIVKQLFIRHAGHWESSPHGGRTWHATQPEVELITKKPLTAARDEQLANPRARSAKLRVAQRRF